VDLPSASPPRTDEAGSPPIPELDGVRGVAILLVLLFHFQGVRPPWVPKFLTYPMVIGWSGVDLFFVLSGFLITRILIATRGSSNYFSAFYARRALRILPLYLLAVFLCFRVGLPLADRLRIPVEADRTVEPWFWLHVSNWASAFGRDVEPLSHFWSLAIEEQFYAVWPLVVLLVPRRRLALACAAIAAASATARMAAAFAGAPAEALHRLTVFRIDALAIGGLLAAVAVDVRLRERLRNRLRLVGSVSFALLVAALVAGRGATAPPMTRYGYTLFAVFYAVFVFAAFDASGSTGWLSARLRSPGLRAFGKYSYAIYVFHYPISLAAGRFARDASRGASAGAATGIWLLAVSGGIAASFGVALLSWNLVEKRFLAWKRAFVARPAPVHP
jgi:peptidoglycan/LPS O-acetylase OafA/YrhL